MVTKVCSLFGVWTTPPLISRPFPVRLASRSRSDQGERQDELKENEYNKLFTQRERNLRATVRQHLSTYHRQLVSLYAVLLLFSSAGLSMFVSSIMLWNKYLTQLGSAIQHDWTETVILVPLSSSIIASASLFLLAINSSRKKRLRKPASFYLAPLASSLLGTLIPLSCLAFTNSSLHDIVGEPNGTTRLDDIDNSPHCIFPNSFTRYCSPTLYRIADLQICGVASSIIAGLVWIAVLALAIRDMRRGNVLAKQVREVQRKIRSSRIDRERGQIGYCCGY